MKVKGLNLSISVIVIIIFMFVVTNVAYFFVTEKTLTNEASKRMDIIMDYIAHYLNLVKANERDKINIVEKHLLHSSSSMAKDLGNSYSNINPEKLKKLKTFYSLDMLEVVKKPKSSIKNEFHVTDDSINYKFTSNELDYYLDITYIDPDISIYEDINGELNDFVNAPSNFYKGVHVTYQFSLFTEPELGFTTFSNLSKNLAYGTYSLLKESDIQYLKKATKETTKYIDRSGPKDLEKYFSPIKVGDQVYILCLISDYGMMKKVMMDQVGLYVYTIVICSLIFIILCVVIFKTFNRNKNKAVELVHVDYENSMETIYLTIKQQRHDFNNTVGTIHSLVTMKEYEELHRYTEEIIEETLELNDLININCAPLIALLQYKYSFASRNRIKLSHDIIDFKQIPNFKYKTNDLIRVLSNLIDNAMEAVMAAKIESKDFVPEVIIHGYLENSTLVFTVSNNGMKIPEDQSEIVMEPGYSTKANGTGLGLSIVNSILDKNNGFLSFKSTEEITVFKATFNINS